MEGDENRGRYAAVDSGEKTPESADRCTLIALDHIEHETGPFSPESIAVLEGPRCGDRKACARPRNGSRRAAPTLPLFPTTALRVTDAQLNLFPPFRDAKLFTVDDRGKITDWKAMPWVTGGSAAIVLQDPGGYRLARPKCRICWPSWPSDPANGIDRVLDADELHKRGGYPAAAFFVSLKPGWKTGYALDGPLLSQTKPGGTHGELPDLPDLRAAFFLVGPGVPAGRSLGILDMRDIAPTLAHLAGLSLPSADGKNRIP